MKAKERHWWLLIAVAASAASSAGAWTPLTIHVHSEQAMFQNLIAPGAVGVDGFVLPAVCDPLMP